MKRKETSRRLNLILLEQCFLHSIIEAISLIRRQKENICEKNILLLFGSKLRQDSKIFIKSEIVSGIFINNFNLKNKPFFNEKRRKKINAIKQSLHRESFQLGLLH